MENVVNELISTEAKLANANVGERVNILAEDLVEMENELSELEFAVNQRRKQLLEAMDAIGISSIKSKHGAKITVIESQRYNINSEIAKQIIETQTPEIQEQLLKVNDSKFRELFPTSEAVSLGKKSRYVKVEAKK